MLTGYEVQSGQNSPWEGILPTFNHTDSCRAPCGCRSISGGEKGKGSKLVTAKNICYESGPSPLFHELFSFLFLCICYLDCLLGSASREVQNSSYKNSCATQVGILFFRAVTRFNLSIMQNVKDQETNGIFSRKSCVYHQLLTLYIQLGELIVNFFDLCLVVKKKGILLLLALPPDGKVIPHSAEQVNISHLFWYKGKSINLNQQPALMWQTLYKRWSIKTHFPLHHLSSLQQNL